MSKNKKYIISNKQQYQKNQINFSDIVVYNTNSLSKYNTEIYETKRNLKELIISLYKNNIISSLVDEFMRTIKYYDYYRDTDENILLKSKTKINNSLVFLDENKIIKDEKQLLSNIKSIFYDHCNLLCELYNDYYNKTIYKNTINEKLINAKNILKNNIILYLKDFLAERLSKNTNENMDGYANKFVNEYFKKSLDKQYEYLIHTCNKAVKTLPYYSPVSEIINNNIETIYSKVITIDSEEELEYKDKLLLNNYDYHGETKNKDEYNNFFNIISNSIIPFSQVNKKIIEDYKINNEDYLNYITTNCYIVINKNELINIISNYVLNKYNVSGYIYEYSCGTFKNNKKFFKNLVDELLSQLKIKDLYIETPEEIFAYLMPFIDIKETFDHYLSNLLKIYEIDDFNLISVEQYEIIERFLINLNLNYNVFDFCCMKHFNNFDFNYESQRQKLLLEQDSQIDKNEQVNNTQVNMHAIDKSFPQLLINNTDGMDATTYLDELLNNDDFLFTSPKTDDEILEQYADKKEKSKRLELLKKLQQNSLQELEQFIKNNNIPITINLVRLNNMSQADRKNELHNILTTMVKYLHPDKHQDENKTKLLQEFNSIWNNIKKNYIVSKNLNWYKFSKFFSSIN